MFLAYTFLLSLVFIYVQCTTAVDLKEYAKYRVKKRLDNAEPMLRRTLIDTARERAIKALALEGREFKRSGICMPVCQHRCIPQCNLACCVPLPKSITPKQINSIEDKARAKIKKNRALKVQEGIKRGKILSYQEVQRGEICTSACRKMCIPPCKFRCCLPKNSKLLESLPKES